MPSNPSSWPGRSCVLAAVLVGCGGSDAGDDAPADVVGSIQIEESRLDASLQVASIYTQFTDPGAPDRYNDGTCRVYEYPCLGQVGACAAPPQYSAGPITIHGLTVPVALTPDPDTHAYPSPSLPPDVFADAAAITVAAPGAGVPGFEIAVGGVVPLESPYVGASPGVVPGQPRALTWTPAADGARIQFRLNWANVCHAGAEWYVLVCDVADTGAFTIPAAATAALPAGSFGPCGGGLARLRRATVPGRTIAVTVVSADYFGFF